MHNSSGHDSIEIDASEHLSFVAHVYVMPVLLVIGFIGQALNLTTLSQPSLRGISFMFLKAIAIADLLSIVLLIPFIYRQADWHDKTCYWSMFYHAHLELPLVNACLGASSFCIVGLTVDRFFTIRYPTRARNGGITAKTTRSVIILMFVLSLLLYVPSCWQKSLIVTKFDVAQNLSTYSITSRGLNQTRWFMVYKLMRELVVRVIPIIILVILNISIVRAFRSIARQHRRLKSQACLLLGREEDGTDPKTPTTTPRSSVTSVQRDIYDAEWRVYVLIAITVLTHIINNLPASVLSMIVSDTLMQLYSFQVFRAVANLLQVTSYMWNFYIYCLCSAEYRQSFYRMLTCTELRRRYRLYRHRTSLAGGFDSKLNKKVAQLAVKHQVDPRHSGNNAMLRVDVNSIGDNLSPQLVTPLMTKISPRDPEVSDASLKVWTEEFV